MSAEKVMLITGASRSIGKYLAEYYVHRGFQVVGCSRNASQFTASHYKHMMVDVTDEVKVKELFAEISRVFGRLDVLLNNAGIQVINYAVLSTVKSVKEVLDINVVAPFLFTREAIKVMKKNRYGRIINFSSVAVPMASIGSSVYSSSKAALEQFSKVVAKEVAQDGITVNNLGLSLVKGSGMAEHMNEKIIDETLKKTIAGTMIGFEDISTAVDFLIAEENKMITGQTMYIGA